MAAIPAPGDLEGSLVVLEGIDGSGKTTVADRLAQRLREQGIEVERTCEPTEGRLGQLVREALSDPEHDPVSEALLFAADHAAHVAELRERLREERVLLSDRYSISWRAYQSVTLEAAWPEKSELSPAAWLEQVAAPFELTPDLVLLLDLPVDRALERVDGRERVTEKFERGRFLERVRERYLELAEEHGYQRVDASGSIEATVEACLDPVVALLDGSDAA